MHDSLDLLNRWLEQKQKDGNFEVPAGAKPSLITTVSSDDPFDPDCLRGLYVLEQALLEKEQDAGAFSIMKYRAGANYPGAADSNITIYGYKIIFNDDSYRVRRKSDMDFLAYFSTLLLGDEPEARPSLLTRLVSWFRKEAF